MNSVELKEAMGHCVSSKLPAGILDNRIEFLAHEHQGFAITSGAMLSPTQWTEEILSAIEADMDMRPEASESLSHAGIEGRMPRIFQYIKCRYSALDNEPDMIGGLLQAPEYVACKLRGACPYEGKLCEHLKTPNGTITPREIEVLKLIAVGLVDKEIADRLGISPLTVPVHMKNLRAKTGAKNKTELALFALQKNLI